MQNNQQKTDKVLYTWNENIAKSIQAKAHHFKTEHWKWSGKMSGGDILIGTPAKRRIIFNPIYANGTTAIRGDKNLGGSKHYFELYFRNGSFGTSTMIGMSDEVAEMTNDSFVQLLGQDKHSWGIDIRTGEAISNGERYKSTALRTPEKEPILIQIYFDAHKGAVTTIASLTLEKNNKIEKWKQLFAITAINELNKKPFVYPTISCTACGISVIAFKMKSKSNTLKEIIEEKVRATLSKHEITQLEIPNTIKKSIIKEIEYHEQPLNENYNYIINNNLRAKSKIRSAEESGWNTIQQTT